jgi:hypothetical protein
MKDMVRRYACSFALAGCLAAPALAAPPCNAPDPAALRSTWQAYRGAALAGNAEQAAQFHKFPLKLLPPMQGPKPMLISRKVFVHNYGALFQRHPDGQEIGLFAAMKAGSGNEAIPKIHFDAQKCALSAPVSVADYDFTYDQKRGWLIEAIEYGGDFDTAKVFDSDKIVN